VRASEKSIFRSRALCGHASNLPETFTRLPVGDTSR